MGIVVCFAPVLLLLASVGFWFAGRGGGYAALSTAVVGLLFGVLNSYLSFVRPWRYRRRHGSMNGYRFVSGLPLFGTLSVVLAGLLGFGELPTAVVGLLALALDTGGSPWFLVQTWRDRGMWDT